MRAVSHPHARQRRQQQRPSTLRASRGTWATRSPDQPLFLQDLDCHCYDPRNTFVLNPRHAWTDTLPTASSAPSAAYYNDFRYQRRPSELASQPRRPSASESVNSDPRRVQQRIFNRALMLNTTSKHISSTPAPRATRRPSEPRRPLHQRLRNHQHNRSRIRRAPRHPRSPNHVLTSGM